MLIMFTSYKSQRFEDNIHEQLLQPRNKPFERFVHFVAMFVVMQQKYLKPMIMRLLP